MCSDPYIGEISIFAGNFAPQGWAMCDGRLLPIVQYQALFSLLGTMYGGDGRTTFAIPDLRGRSVVGTGSGPGLTPRNIGQNGGYEKVGLGVNEMPVHNHTAQSQVTGTITGKLKGINVPGTLSNLEGSYIASHAGAFLRTGTTSDMSPGAVQIDASTMQVNTTIGNAGNNQQHENMHPFLALNYIIALEGIYPPRD